MPSNFNPKMADTHVYVGRTSGDQVRSYLYKGTGHMVNVADWEPQRTNNFEVVIEGLDTLVTAGAVTATSLDNGQFSADPTADSNGVLNPANAAERIMLSVDSFSAPTIEIAQITTHYGNNSVKWAGKPDFPNSSLVINDYIGIQVEQILAAWFRCAYDFKTETIGLASNYKKTAYLIEYAPNGAYARAWRLDGCWLASFQLGDWNQAGNDQRKLTATLVYDRVIPDYGLDDTKLLKMGSQKYVESDVRDRWDPYHRAVTK